MSGVGCCVRDGRTGGGPLVRRVGRGLRWGLAGVGLALAPKCPMCLVVWIALATGVGISMTAAVYLKAAMVTVSAMLLVYGVVRRVASA